MVPKSRLVQFGFFNEANTLESSSILIYFKQQMKASRKQMKLSKVKSSFEES
jgi:hypothetical protein